VSSTKRKDDEDRGEAEAATKIQSIYRGNITRQKTNDMLFKEGKSPRGPRATVAHHGEVSAKAEPPSGPGKGRHSALVTPPPSPRQTVRANSIISQFSNASDMQEDSSNMGGSVSHSMGGAASSSSRRKRDPAAELDAERVFELDQLADGLKGNVKKFPKSGVSHGSAHMRYLVVEPAGERLKQGHRHANHDWHQELRLWRRGRLAYWQTQKNYEQGDPPSGAIGIMQVSKVEHKGNNVMVRHKQANNVGELVLELGTEEQAAEFRSALHKLRGELQRSVMMV